MSIIVNPAYSHWEPFLSMLPERFEAEGTLVYQGRNTIKVFRHEGTTLVAKRFGHLRLFKAVVYTFFRKNKARRAFENASMLRSRGFGTPGVIACIEKRRGGLLREVYYVSQFTDYEPIRPRLVEQEPFDRALATAYARFVARLHESGVLHRDLNPTNVLFKEHDGEYAFQLIDINRMRFYDGPVPKADCMENLTLFWWLTEVYRFVLQVYASARGWTAGDVEQAVRVKQQHDRRWVRRKSFTGKLKKILQI